MAVSPSSSNQSKTAKPQLTLGQRMAGMLPSSELPDVARTLTEQKYTTLSTAFEAIKPDSERAKEASETYKKVKAILDIPPGQRDPDKINEVEQGLVQLQAPEDLRTTLLRKLDEAKRNGRVNLAFYEGRIMQEQLDKPDDIEKKETSIRELLVRLTDAMQAFDQQHQLRHKCARIAAGRVARLFLVAMALFVALLLITDPKEQGTEQATQPVAGATNKPDAEGAKPDAKPLTAFIEIVQPAGFAAVLFAISAGFFGATFFMLIRLRTLLTGGSAEDIEDFASGRNLAVRCLFGIGAALILYFFFKSGLLEGSIWPDLENLGFKKCCADAEGNGGLVANMHLSLLIVWSFLAGFSERFVPSMLERTEGRANSANN